MRNQNQNAKRSRKRYNRRRDGVTTIQSTPEKQIIEEVRLREQWNEFWNRAIESYYQDQ